MDSFNAAGFDNAGGEGPEVVRLSRMVRVAWVRLARRCPFLVKILAAFGKAGVPI